MSSDNDETAFPTRDWKPGMSLRDYFAAMALQGMCASQCVSRAHAEHVDLAQNAYKLADAMLEGRKNKA